MHYHVGWNLTGYLPEMDPYIVADIETALEELRTEAEMIVDSLAAVVDGAELDEDDRSVRELQDAESLRDELAAILGGDTESYARFGWNGEIGYVHYWIVPCPIDGCETDYCAECGQDVPAHWRDARGEPTCEECERELQAAQL